MIVDSSAIVAIARNESTRPTLVRALLSAERSRIVAPVWLETSIVLLASGIPQPHEFLSTFEREFTVEVLPFTAEHGRAARDAWTRFGRGNHPAKLNFGDCMSYAAASLAGEPLLFVGDDFTQTDIESALA
ncbi:MAG: type II toxin-antitoxin system VapC family toxin [Pseudolysinimonas sp.]